MTGDDPRVPAPPPRSLTKAVVAGALLIAGGVLVVMAVLPRILSRETAQPAAAAPGAPRRPVRGASRRPSSMSAMTARN